MLVTGATGHYLNQCWLIGYRTIRSKLDWTLNKNTKTFKKMHSEMVDIFLGHVVLSWYIGNIARLVVSMLIIRRRSDKAPGCIDSFAVIHIFVQDKLNRGQSDVVYDPDISGDTKLDTDIGDWYNMMSYVHDKHLTHLPLSVYVHFRWALIGFSM